VVEPAEMAAPASRASGAELEGAQQASHSPGSRPCYPVIERHPGGGLSLSFGRSAPEVTVYSSTWSVRPAHQANRDPGPTTR
jgi:hypothetical protein